MTDQILFDRLRYMDRLKQAGISDDQARAHADAIDEALRESVATRSDIAQLRSDFGRLESKVEIAVRDITIRTGGMVAASVVFLAALKFFG